jgi:mannose-6-phosphate isomerase
MKPDRTVDDIRLSLINGTLADQLVSMVPKPGDAVFIPAGTVHTLGGGVVVFEVQQNSDVTFRLYDWGHIDAETGKPRPLQVDKALACIDFEGNTSGLVAPRIESTVPVERERLFDCEPFRLWRLLGQAPFPVGATAEPRVLVCIGGSGQVEHDNIPYATGKGDIWLLPAEVGVCAFRPSQEVTLLEIAIHGS